jgi:hypothetical protein
MIAQSTSFNSHEWPARLRRREASAYLYEKHGIQKAPQTLAAMAVRGVGPKYSLCGRIPLYTPQALDHYAEKQLTPEAASTAAHKVARAGAR